MTVIEAISALTALTNLALRSSEAAARVSQIVQRAQTEGRDLSDREIEDIERARSRALIRWNSTKF